MKLYHGVGVEINVKTIDTTVLHALHREIVEELNSRQLLALPGSDAEWRAIKNSQGGVIATTYYRRVMGAAMSLVDAKAYIDSL